jgi:hypothetical protein
VLLLSLSSLSLSLSFFLSRIKLIMRGVNYLFYKNNVSHELLHHVESKIFFKFVDMFDLV